MLVISPDELGLGAGVDQTWAQSVISTVVARAALVAPCLATLEPGGLQDAAKGVLIDVVVRRYHTRGMVPGMAVSKAMADRSTSSDTKDLPRALFWPEEIAELQSICAASAAAGGATAAPVVAPVGSFPAAQRWPDPAEPCRRRWPV